MKRVTRRLAIAVITFLIGVAFAGLCTALHDHRGKTALNVTECIPKYSSVSSSAKEDDLKVNRRSPSSEFREAGVYLVELSGLKTAVEKY